MNIAGYKIVLTVAMLLFSNIRLSYAYWWALGTQGLNVVRNSRITETASVCNSLQNISEKQKKLCKEYPDLIKSVALGAKISIAECKYQFKDTRWNCPVTNDGTSVFGKILEKGTREAAFIHAITAAGLSSAVTEACAQGKSTHCSCDNSYRRAPGNVGWRWGGCSRDFNFGLKFSEKFVDDKKKGRRSPRIDMNKHNNGAGREAIRRHLYRKCKCHGLSGSCEIKTCWINLPKFRIVGKFLRGKYDDAHEMKVAYKRKGNSQRYRRLKPKNRNLDKPTAQDLIYYEQSPNFCRTNVQTGSVGTRGRECNITSSGDDGCARMCCRRGTDFKAVAVTKSCKCKFVWCCRVQCQKCTEIRKIYTCK
eukprot:gene17845-19626_t